MEVQGAQGEPQLDLIIKRRSTLRTERHDVKDFLVIGELTSSDKSARWKRKFLQLATYMRDIFSAQPTRRFVHGFLLFSTQMQLWIFDRSGAYSSDTFDVLQQPDRFIRAVTGYALMTDEELGLDTFIKRDGQQPSVVVADAITGEDVTLKLEASPFIIQRAIVKSGHILLPYCRSSICRQIFMEIGQATARGGSLEEVTRREGHCNIGGLR